jgi:hypothetical protein
MRAYSLTVVKVLYCLSLAALSGCVSSGAKAPGANAPCKTDDGCPSEYQCLLATTGASGLFCCKDSNSCGPAGQVDASGSAIDGAMVLDGPSSKGGAIDVASGGGSGGTGIDGGNAGASGSGGSGIEVNTGGGGTGGANAPMATGGTSAGGATGFDARTGASDAPGTDTIDAPGGAGGTGGTKGSGGGGGASGGAPGSGGVLGSGGIAASGGAVATGGVVGTGGTTTCQPKARDCTSSLDNDCNGTPDNQDSTCVCPAGTSGPCPGNNNLPCKSGTRTCILSADKTSTAWSTTCVGQVLPAAADTCSRGNDANCNGVPNEGCQCINEDSPQACLCGTQTCTNGKLNACVTTCTATQTCSSAGTCVCNTGLTSCNGACVNTQSDPNNCGTCGFGCGNNGLGCSAGQCTCTANTPNGIFCKRPGQVNGTCWSGACVLPAYFSGCNTAADCVPGGCTGPGGYCLGTIGVAGEVSCTDNDGAYVVCSTSQGCSPGPLTGQVQCGDGNGGIGVFACDGPNDCPGDSDCCTRLGTRGYFCVARAQPGVIGSGCAALDTNPNGPQSSVVCDPLNPTTTCPTGKSCVTNAGTQVSFGCQ